METVYKLSIKLEGIDTENIVQTLDYIANRIEEGTFIDTRNYINESEHGVDGVVIWDKDERCEHCKGTGEVATDEDDGEGHIMRGVGTAKCICQKQSQSE